MKSMSVSTIEKILVECGEIAARLEEIRLRASDNDTAASVVDDMGEMSQLRAQIEFATVGFREYLRDDALRDDAVAVLVAAGLVAHTLPRHVFDAALERLKIGNFGTSHNAADRGAA